MAHGYPDFEGDKSGLYPKPEWAAKEGTDKTLWCEKDNASFGEFAIVLYPVPAGKTLYIVGSSCQSQVDAAANYDHHLYVQIGMGGGASTGATKAGLGGCALSLAKPMVIKAGVTFFFLVANRANLACFISGSAWGYEVTD